MIADDAGLTSQSIRESKCKCGVVELPVLPDSATSWPCTILSPTLTSTPLYCMCQQTSLRRCVVLRMARDGTAGRIDRAGSNASVGTLRPTRARRSVQAHAQHEHRAGHAAHVILPTGRG